MSRPNYAHTILPEILPSAAPNEVAQRGIEVFEDYYTERQYKVKITAHNYVAPPPGGIAAGDQAQCVWHHFPSLSVFRTVCESTLDHATFRDYIDNSVAGVPKILYAMDPANSKVVNTMVAEVVARIPQLPPLPIEDRTAALHGPEFDCGLLLAGDPMPAFNSELSPKKNPVTIFVAMSSPGGESRGAPGLETAMVAVICCAIIEASGIPCGITAVNQSATRKANGAHFNFSIPLKSPGSPMDAASVVCGLHPNNYWASAGLQQPMGSNAWQPCYAHLCDDVVSGLSNYCLLQTGYSRPNTEEELLAAISGVLAAAQVSAPFDIVELLPCFEAIQPYAATLTTLFDTYAG